MREVGRMKRKELEAMVEAYNHLLAQEAETLDIPYAGRGTYKRMSKKDYEALEPLFMASKQTNYKIGKVEFELKTMLAVGAIILEDEVYVSAERCNEHLQDIYYIISHLMIWDGRITLKDLKETNNE